MTMIFCRGCGKEIHETAPICPHCGAPQQVAPTFNASAAPSLKSQTVAGLLCAFLGGIGIHKFYLGRITAGVIYLVFCWTGIPGLLAIFDLFGIAFSKQENWAKKYNQGTITPPVSIVVKIIVLALPAIAAIGILAAIALPAYQDYTLKAKTMNAVAGLSTAKILASDYAAAKGGALLDEETLQKIKLSTASIKEITEVDAFAYKKYADIVATLSIGQHTGSIIFVTQDAGAAWSCGYRSLPQKYVPKNCVVSEGLARPALDKPKIGLWDIDFATATLNSCTRTALEKGEANAADNCKCIILKLAQVTPQSEMSDNLNEEQLQIVEQARYSCSQ